MATKTGSGAVTATGSGGENVANTAGTTYFTMSSPLTLTAPFTVIVKVKRESSAGDAGMVLGNGDASNQNYIWLRASEIRPFGATVANTGSDSWATFTYVKNANGTGALYKNGALLTTLGFATSGVVQHIMSGYSSNTYALSGALEYMHIIPGLAASAGQVSSLYADPYQALDIVSGATITGNLGTATASGLAASILGSVAIACSMGGATASGHQATVSVGGAVTISCAVGTATASGKLATVTSSGSATITTDAFKNNVGSVLTALTVSKISALKLSDMTLAASWTSQATDGSGVLSLTSVGLTSATDYLLVTSSTDGLTVGVKKYTAA
jgi:hypothetical protein